MFEDRTDPLQHDAIERLCDKQLTKAAWRTACTPGSFDASMRHMLQ